MCEINYGDDDDDDHKCCSVNLKVAVRAEILPRDILQTSGNYYL